MSTTSFDHLLLEAAYQQARLGLQEGGIPIGSALGSPDLGIIALGRNRRVQHDDTTAHAETDCINNAGRRRDWHTLSLATTLSPCIMCAGTALLFKIPRIIIGESHNFQGEEQLLASRNVKIIHANDQRCIDLMTDWISENPELWNEDIGIPPQHTDHQPPANSTQAGDQTGDQAGDQAGDPH